MVFTLLAALLLTPPVNAQALDDAEPELEIPEVKSREALREEAAVAASGLEQELAALRSAPTALETPTSSDLGPVSELRLVTRKCDRQPLSIFPPPEDCAYFMILNERDEALTYEEFVLLRQSVGVTPLGFWKEQRVKTAFYTGLLDDGAGLGHGRAREALTNQIRKYNMLAGVPL